MSEDVLLGITLASVVVWAIATWHLRHGLSTRPVATLLLVLVWAGLVGQLARSLLDDGLSEWVIAVVRGLYLVIGITLAWAGPTRMRH